MFSKTECIRTVKEKSGSRKTNSIHNLMHLVYKIFESDFPKIFNYKFSYKDGRVIYYIIT